MIRMGDEIWHLVCIIDKGLRGSRGMLGSMTVPLHPDSMESMQLTNSAKLLREMADDVEAKRAQLISNQQAA